MSSGLITPNFSSDSSGRHTDYIEQLSFKYATLSKLDLEEPHYEADEDRVLALRGRIQEAWSRAEGNPASGKWIRITRLLRMGVTSGRGGKWVGARADVKSPECPENASGWISTMSESDWREWEQKFMQDHRLKKMVENWKKGVEVTNHPESSSTRSQMVAVSHPATKDSRRLGSSILQIESGIASDKQITKPVPATSVDPLNGSAPFGFGVVKRTSQANVLNSKPDASGNKNRPGLPAVSEAPERSKGTDKHTSRGPKVQTTSGVGLLPMHPSFSGSQLLTSTPKQTAKPTARPELSSPLTPLISSPSKRTLLGRASSLASPPGQSKAGQNEPSQGSPSRRGVESAVSLPVIPSLERPLRHTTSQPKNSDTPDLLNTNNKRIHSSSHSYPVAEVDSRKSKRPKTISSNKPTPQTPPPPQQGQLPTAVPTLTELLASAKKGKKKRPQRKELDHKQQSTSKPRLPAQVSDDGEEEITPFFDPFPVDDGDGNIQELDRQPDPDFYSHLNDSNVPIAGASDGEEEEAVGHTTGGGIDEFVLDSSFRPLATSTQVPVDHERRRGPFVSKVNLGKPVITQPNDPSRPGGKGKNATDSWESIYAPPPHDSDAFPGLSAASSGKNNDNDNSFPQLSYNTQFESAIAAEVEKVNKLLQRDVNCDITPVEDRERDEEKDDSGESLSDGGSGPLREGRNGYSYGYGKAFEYDQSF